MEKAVATTGANPTSKTLYHVATLAVGSSCQSTGASTEGLFIGTASTQLINRSSEDRDRAIGGLSSSPRSHRRFSP